MNYSFSSLLRETSENCIFYRPTNHHVTSGGFRQLGRPKPIRDLMVAIDFEVLSTGCTQSLVVSCLRCAI